MSETPSLEKTLQEALNRIQNAKTQEEILAIRHETLGKTGSLGMLLRGVKDLSNEEKKTLGQSINAARDTIESALAERETTIGQAQIEAEVQNGFEDFSAPYGNARRPHVHPVTHAINELERIFHRMGFEVLESKELVTEYENFDAVNIPASHPARDMQDTFWVEGLKHVLSTQTSSMQNTIMRTRKPPFQVVIPGRVFRNEATDATHECQFYQVEGIVVGKDIHLGHLKYTLQTMLSDLFGRSVEIRMRPGFFPFVEPGVEVDFSCPFCSGNGCRICKKTGWVEFMGAGLIHPNVLKEGGIDSSIWSGFAFGFGLYRLAMMLHSIPDIRLLQTPNAEFLEQF